MLSNRNILFFLAAVVVLMPALAFGQEWGEVRQATVNLNVRQAPNKNSEHVLTLAKGQRVKCDFEENGWIAVFNLGEKTRDKSRAVGYANARYLEVVTPKPTPTVETVDEVEAAPKKQSKPVAKVESGEGEVKSSVVAEPSQDPVKMGVDPNLVPVKISSDRMTYDESGKVVSFVGNVVATHGELTLWADRLSAYLASKTNKKFSADSIDRIIAQGNVKATKGKSSGSCGKLTYYVNDQLLQMEEDPILKDGPNSLAGEVIKFHLRDNRSEVIGGSKRVKAIFMTPDTVKVP